MKRLWCHQVYNQSADGPLWRLKKKERHQRTHNDKKGAFRAKPTKCFCFEPIPLNNLLCRGKAKTLLGSTKSYCPKSETGGKKVSPRASHSRGKGFCSSVLHDYPTEVRNQVGGGIPRHACLRKEKELPSSTHVMISGFLTFFLTFN